MLCRLCLKDSTTTQNVINSNLRCAELTLIDSLYWIFGVEVDINDPYSKYICARCETVVQYIGSYRTLYQRNQLVLEGKLDTQDDLEEFIDPVEINYGGGQLTDTAETHTSDEPEFNSKTVERRREMVRYYYEIPTTAIRELIKNQTNKPTNSNDISLFEVNEVVNVEVCKYCSEIFKTKGPLQAHYNTKHKSVEKRMKLKQLRRKRKNLLTFHKGKGGTFYKKLLNRYSEFDKLIDPTNSKNNFLFDATHFPNLNFAKQLDTFARKKAALKTIGRSKDSNGEQIITVKITDNCHYKWLDLKDFCISLERCAIPEEFCQVTDETEHTLAKGEIPDTAAVKVRKIEAINDNNISSTLLKWAKTLNEKLMERKTNYKQISSNKNGPETENNHDSCEDPNSDDDTHIPNDYDCLSDDTENTQNDISNPHQWPITKDVCISLQRCKVPTQPKLTETEHWKKQISKRLLKLQRIISTDFEPGRVKIERARERLEIVSDTLENVIPVEINDLEVQTQTIKIGNNQNLTPVQRMKLKLKDAYVSIERCPLPHDFYQDRQEKEKNLFHKISENSKPQRWKMNLFETLFRVKGIFQEYDRTKQHITTNDLGTQSENTLNKVHKIPETSKIPQRPQKWTTNLYETLFKVKGIAEEFEKTKHNKTDLGTHSENTVHNEKPLKENCEDALHKRSIHLNRRKSMRIRQTKRSDLTHHNRNFNKTDHPIRSMQIVIPNIDSFLRENGYIFDKISDQSKRDERRDSITSNCMPQLENEIKCVTPLRDTLDEPPQLEPQVQKSAIIDVLSTKLKKRTIKNINTEKNLKLNPPKRRKKVNDGTGLADELGQVTASLKLIKIRDSSDSDWINKKLNMFDGLSVNNWKDRVFRNDSFPDQSIEFDNLINANLLHAPNDLDGKESGIEVDDKIKQKNIPHCLRSEEKDLDNCKAVTDKDTCQIPKNMEDSNHLKSDADNKFQTKTWKHQISNVLLKLNEIKGSNTTKQVNSEICLKETDVTEIHKGETPNRLNVPEESTSFVAKSNILPHSDENSCQISNNDLGDEKDDSDNTRSIQGTNSQWCNQSETNIAIEQQSHPGCQNSCQISNDDFGNEKDDSDNTRNIKGTNSQRSNESETNIANECLFDPSSSLIPVTV